MKKIVVSAMVFILGLTFLAVAGEASPEQLKRGAQLYDKWYALNGNKPSETHPAYPESGKKKGDTTWRCKECHGWDYIGNEGRYASGSHFTGIKGVDGVSSWSQEGLEKLLGPKGSHDYTAWLSRDDISALAVFLRKGLVDSRKAIGADGQALGSAGSGAPLFAAQCASCHGPRGQGLDFKPGKEGVQGIGWLARDNPQETLHKVLWGHPGSDMPSMIVDAQLSFEQVIDLLSYSQKLP